MPVFEIINPSDAYTVVGEMPALAVAVLAVSQGQYGLKDPEGEYVLPILAFEGEGAMDKFLAEHGITNLMAYISENADEITACMESVLIGDFVDRATYQTGLDLIDDPEKRKEWAAKWHDDHRSSENDIGKVCWNWAAHIRKTTKENPNAGRTEDNESQGG